MNEKTAGVIAMPEVMQRRERQAMVAVDPNATPVQLLAIATQQGVSMEALEKFMDLADRWEKNEARKAFVKAKADFKKNPPKVIKDAKNKQYDSMYASIGNLVNTINPALGEHGLEASWTLAQNGAQTTVGCKLSHELGHTEIVELTAGPDTSGAKNPLQQIKSTVTYLKIATFEAITGVIAINKDDDGNASGSGKQPEEPAPPAGYEKWSMDLEAVAEEGEERLKAAWAASDMTFRSYTTRYDAPWWARVKSKAKKVGGAA